MYVTEPYFDDTSMLRRVVREWAVAFSGPRALLMMAAHPVAFEGFFMSTGALDDPYARLRRTGVVLDEIIWGDRRRADAYTSRVRAAHATVTGTIPHDAGRFPAGTPYAADDPELLLWILATLVDSALLAYQRYVTSLSRDERDALWRDYKVIGNCFGIPDADMPDAIEDFEDYMAEMTGGDILHVTPRAADLGKAVVLHPPAPTLARPLVEAVNFLTIGTLPPGVRKGYGFSWDPARELALRANAAYVKRAVLPFVPSRLRHLPVSRGAPISRAA